MRVLVRIHQTWFYKELEKDSIDVGRSNEADVTIPLQGISRRHVRLFRYNNRWAVVDLGSRHGTRVNNEPTDARGTFVGEQDVVELGPAQIGVQLRMQTDMSRPLPPNCQLLVNMPESLSIGGSGPISPGGDEEETQIASALPPPRSAVPPRSASAMNVEALVAPPASAALGRRAAQKAAPAIPNEMDSQDMVPPARFVPGGVPAGEEGPVGTAPTVLHPIVLANGEVVLQSVALGHHSVWVTGQRFIWKGVGEYQSLFWRDVLAVSAEGGLVSFRMRESAMGVDLPVGQPYATDLLPVIQDAREQYDAQRVMKELAG